MDQETFYYLQLLFDNNKTRDRTYGKEFEIAYTQESDLSLAVTNRHEVLHRRKGIHLTGIRRWYGGLERLPTIELLLILDSDATLELLLQTGDYSVGTRSRVTEGTLSFTTGETTKRLLESFQSELKIQRSGMAGVTEEFLKIRSYRNKNLEATFHRLDGMVKGDIRSVLKLYNFARSFGVSYSSISLNFS